MDGRTYTFRDELQGSDGEVRIHDTPSDTLENLEGAINGRSATVNRYVTSTPKHQRVAAVEGYGDALDVFPQDGAADANPFAVETTMTNGFWVDNETVTKLAASRGYLPRLGIHQVTYYDVGVGGTRFYPGSWNRVHRWIDIGFGGARGAGFEANVEEAYTFLAHNYRAGDEILRVRLQPWRSQCPQSDQPDRLDGRHLGSVERLLHPAIR
ncbi:MAG: DUF2235 domain-containing protein [Gemmatimonadota bacterium]|nr:DUF2235 domain-containing protein [Gemmatimonadota bacterium]